MRPPYLSMRPPYLLYLVSLITCLVTLGCGRLTQPQVAEGISHSPLTTPQGSEARATAVVTPTRTLYLPTLTPTSSQPTPTPTPNFQVTLDQTKLGPPVTELIYMTTDRVRSVSPEYLSTIWRTDLENITQPQIVITFTHQQYNFLQDLTLSPDSEYLVFGDPYDQIEMSALLLNIDQGDLQIVDYGASFQNNTNSFFWSADSKSFVYTKILDGWFSTALYQYSLDTQITEYFKADGYINLIGRQDSLIYYGLHVRGGKPYTVSSLDIETMQTQSIYSLTTLQEVSYVTMSPNGKLTLFTNQVVDLTTKRQIATLPFNHPLWIPDSQGLIATDPYAKDTAIKLKSLSEAYVEPLTLKFDLPVPPNELLAWSPDGHYLIYHPPQTTAYYLVNTISGRVQEFEPTILLTVGGWLRQ